MWRRFRCGQLGKLLLVLRKVILLVFEVLQVFPKKTTKGCFLLNFFLLLLFVIVVNVLVPGTFFTTAQVPQTMSYFPCLWALNFWFRFMRMIFGCCVLVMSGTCFDYNIIQHSISTIVSLLSLLLYMKRQKMWHLYHSMCMLNHFVLWKGGIGFCTHNLWVSVGYEMKDLQILGTLPLRNEVYISGNYYNEERLGCAEYSCK